MAVIQPAVPPPKMTTEPILRDAGIGASAAPEIIFSILDILVIVQIEQCRRR
ncbi:hypothetical protein [Sphingomonas sp. GB1N7]|uniref:hypothetical protein n=1 Tax=Parasphingomonas caseinilytica TaxID=3096158 RepID=UPI002FC621F3